GLLSGERGGSGEQLAQGVAGFTARVARKPPTQAAATPSHGPTHKAATPATTPTPQAARTRPPGGAGQGPDPGRLPPAATALAEAAAAQRRDGRAPGAGPAVERGLPGGRPGVG